MGYVNYFVELGIEAQAGLLYNVYIPINKNSFGRK